MRLENSVCWGVCVELCALSALLLSLSLESTTSLSRELLPVAAREARF